MARRVVYQIDPKRKNPDGSFPDFVFKNSQQKSCSTKWLHTLYLKIAHNASTRNIPFSLPFLSFIHFCRNTNYHILRGRSSDSMTIDRKNNLKGYTQDNIQALTLLENIRKYRTVDIKLGKREMG